MHAVDAPHERTWKISLEKGRVEVLTMELTVGERKKNRTDHVVLRHHLRGARQRKVEEVAAANVEADMDSQEENDSRRQIGERIRDRLGDLHHRSHWPLLSYRRRSGEPNIDVDVISRRVRIGTHVAVSDVDKLLRLLARDAIQLDHHRYVYAEAAGVAGTDTDLRGDR